MQDTLIAGLDAGALEMDRRSAATWLRTTARNRYVDHLRRVARRREVHVAERLEIEWVEQGALDGEELTALRHCLGCLDQRERLALEMRYGERASRSRMGVMLGVGPDGVKSLLRRARRRLRECIERRIDD